MIEMIKADVRGILLYVPLLFLYVVCTNVISQILCNIYMIQRAVKTNIGENSVREFILKGVF